MKASGLWTVMFVSLVGVRRVSSGPIVHTKNGDVEGFTKSVEGVNIDWYLGIPYAKPPVGDLRFRRSEPAEPWSGVLNATATKQSCTQEISPLMKTIFEGALQPGEDCLYLNVYVPQRNSRYEADGPLDVLVYIHGGAYIIGTGNDHMFVQFAAYASVVVVAVNYRLGALGFLYLGTEEAPGNQGLWDQHLALRWVHENIAAFGGNPNSVTINGPSAGAGSVSVQVVSLKNAGLFKAAVMSSGSFPSPWGYQTPAVALEAAEKFTSLLNCTGSEAVKCLRNITVPQLLATGALSFTGALQISLQPTVDGELITDAPFELLKKGEFNRNVSILGGNNGNEGSAFYMMEFSEIYNAQNDSTLTAEAVQKAVDKFLKDKPESVRRAVQNAYFNQSDMEDGARNRDTFIDLMGDYLFVCPVNEFLALAGDQNPTVYNYFFTQRFDANSSGEAFGLGNGTLPSWLGSIHAAILGYETGGVYYNKNLTEADQRLSADTMDMLKRFMATGEVQFAGLEKWPRYSSDNPIYVELNADGPSQGIGPRASFCEHLETALQVLS